MAALIVLAVLVGIVLIGGGIWLGVRHYKKHKEALAGFAASHGWTYTERDDSYGERWHSVPFGMGHSRQATNVMTGAYGVRPAIVFDYRYNETTHDSQGSHETTYRFSIYAMQLPCAIPGVALAPEGFFAKVGHAMGVHDIQLESEQFNKAFRLTADDQKTAYDIIPARTMQLLLTQPDVHLRTEGGSLLCIDKKWLDVQRIDQRLQLMAGFLDNIPNFVWDDHRPGATPGGS